MNKARLYELTDWLELSDLDWIGTGYYSQTWGIIVLVIVDIECENESYEVILEIYLGHSGDFEFSIK